MTDAVDATLPAPIATIDDATAAELRRLCEAATPGPWSHWKQPYADRSGSGVNDSIFSNEEVAFQLAGVSKHDAKLIVAARNALPRLLDDRDAYERRIAELTAERDAQNERIGAVRREALEEAISIAHECERQAENNHGAANTGGAEAVAVALLALISEPTP